MFILGFGFFFPTQERVVQVAKEHTQYDVKTEQNETVCLGTGTFALSSLHKSKEMRRNSDYLRSGEGSVM